MKLKLENTLQTLWDAHLAGSSSDKTDTRGVAVMLNVASKRVNSPFNTLLMKHSEHIKENLR